MVVYTDTFRRKWSSSTSPCLVQHTGVLPILSINSNIRSETLDLRIKSKGKVPPNFRTKEKSKAWKPKMTCQSHKKRKTP